VLDEVMTRLLWERGTLAVTVELTVRLKKPVPVLQPCQARSRLVSSRKRVHTVEGEILLADGLVAAPAREVPEVAEPEP
jgi:acyl-coenzyme A thioesterase PaaI-like protein